MADEHEGTPENDAIFQEEQAHLTDVHHELHVMAETSQRKLEEVAAAAAAFKKEYAEEVRFNGTSDDELMETYAAIESINRVVDAQNLTQEINTERLRGIAVALRRPYFAKIAVRLAGRPDVKNLYIGDVGLTNDDCERLTVDWRSPVSELYYNQETGPTSYVANGRTIEADLLLRRQFDIEGARLNAYFDTSIALQDSLLVNALMKRRSEHMRAITATIQKEQNAVIRHDDVPTLLVDGIAGSGKTSVLLQRIAYLLYQNRDKLQAQDMYLFTPNALFGRYIENVLPDLGEANPNIQTWDELCAQLLPAGRGIVHSSCTCETLDRIDEILPDLQLQAHDFTDIGTEDTTLLTARQIWSIYDKYAKLPAGSHRITLVREELGKRLEKRLDKLAGSEQMYDTLDALPLDEQLSLFGEMIGGQSDAKMRTFARMYLEKQFDQVAARIERDEWIRIDRIGMRMLGADNLDAEAFLYLKMRLTGLSCTSARCVIVDEVQDYSDAQLQVMAAYFPRAHFMLLGDEHQAIQERSVDFARLEKLFGDVRGPVSRCSLRTSYRSTPEITALFAQLMDESERMNLSSVQREETKPRIVACADDAAYDAALAEAVEAACALDELTAIIVPYGKKGAELAERFADKGVGLIEDAQSLPTTGCIAIPLKLAKGLEFDHVIVPEASSRVFKDDPLSRNRLYTTISRATRKVTLLAHGSITPLLNVE